MAWEQNAPDILLCEVACPNEIGGGGNHMAPRDLEVELVAYRKRWQTPLRVITIHMTPWHEPAIRDQLREVSLRLGVEIELAYEGVVIDV